MRSKLFLGVLAASLMICQFSYAASGTGIGETYTTYKQRSAAPATPSAGYFRLYFKTDGKLYSVNSSGTETAAGAGVQTSTECDAAGYYTDGTLCQDTDDNKLYLGTGAAVLRILNYNDIGSTIQTADAELTALAGLASAANAIPYFTGEGTAGVISSSANMVSLLGSADYATARTNLGTWGVSGEITDEQLVCSETTGGSNLLKSCGAKTTNNGTTGNVLVTTGANTVGDLSAENVITSGTMAGKLVRVDGHTAISPLTAAQVTGTIIRNTGQALADVNHTLPQAAAGYNFIAFVGTTLAATNYWRFTADADPQDYMCLDGTCGKAYVSVDTPTRGDTLTCYTEQMSSTGLKNEADLGIGTSANTAVKNTVAVEFDIAGTGYSKAIAETAPGNDTIPQNKYGAVAFEIGADGTIDAIEATANATGYDSAALAIAGIPAVAASHTRLGTVTAMSTEAGGFVFGTTALNAANTTVAYTDATVYTPAYVWVCITGKGTWTTD